MDITIRAAIKEDCPRMMELIKELAAYENAPEQVTVSFEHFTESGFGASPVWWAYVAEVNGCGRCLTGMSPPSTSTKNLKKCVLIPNGSTAASISNIFFLPGSSPLSQGILLQSMHILKNKNSYNVFTSI